MPIKLAISPCPNDTFIFSGILAGAVQLPEQVEILLLDIQELNAGVASEAFDISKVSSVAALRYSKHYSVSSVGAAIGYGVGPLVVSRPGMGPPQRGARVLAPGIDTTAYALFRGFFSQVTEVHHRIFSEIMPAVVRGEFDYGVVIHEGRFAYQELGLECVADLGALWEARYRLPLPLGCLVAHRRLPEELVKGFERAVRSSLDYGYSNREKALEIMRRHATLLDKAAIWAHVDLYVNQRSRDLGPEGLEAFGKLERIINPLRK